jgi:hypothetical protein
MTCLPDFSQVVIAKLTHDGGRFPALGHSRSIASSQGGAGLSRQRVQLGAVSEQQLPVVVKLVRHAVDQVV